MSVENLAKMDTERADAPRQSESLVALAGGVGGARLIDGLAQRLGARLSAIVNTADDFVHLGLSISPDLDTVTYTLSGLANPETGWGRAGESWAVMGALGQIGGEIWFRLGDQDIATHLVRTDRLRKGQRLTEITRDLCRSLGIAAQVLPMSDQAVATIVHSATGDLAFQDYFVRLQCAVPVSGFSFAGVEQARPSAEVQSALSDADNAAIVICPSNPYVSIEPILAVPGMRDLIEKANVPVIAVSPIIGGKAVKGPAGKMMLELGQDCSVEGIAAYYGSLLSGIVIDEQDAAARPRLEARGLRVAVTDTMMRSSADRLRVADSCIDLARACRG